jgi:hypothetical protein
MSSIEVRRIPIEVGPAVHGVGERHHDAAWLQFHAVGERKRLGQVYGGR